MSLLRILRALFMLIQQCLAAAWSFFVRWFLPLPALDEIREADEEEDKQQVATTAAASPVPATEMPAPVPPIPPEPAPEIRAPEGAESRAARGSSPVNPFE